MTGEWEVSSHPASWRRVLGPVVLVVAGLVAGQAMLPATSEPTFPVDVEPPAVAPVALEPTSAEGDWLPMAAGPLSARQRPVSAWTGEELLVWGGRVALRGHWFADGAAYDPAADEWRALPPAPLRARAGASGVWTGTELVVWGGSGAADAPDPAAGDSDAPELATTTQSFADGAAYNPSTDRWRPLAPAPLSPRREAPAVWTGSEVVVWGGSGVGEAHHEPDGARYDPETDRWTPIAGGPLAPGTNSLVRMVALDGQVLIWSSTYTRAQAAVYDPATDSWQDIPTPALRPGVVPAAAAVAGGVMLWGESRHGDDRPAAVRYTTSTARWITVAQPPQPPEPDQALVPAEGTAVAWQRGGGVVFDGVTNRWLPLPEGPDLATGTVQAWAGDRLLVWSPDGSSQQRGATWKPDNPWRPLPRPPADLDAAGTAVWTGWLDKGRQVLVWGGLDHGSPRVGAGYDPAVGLWEAIPPGPLPRRVDPAAAWVGQEMLVVGGRDLPRAPGLRDAAAYSPADHRWRTLPDAPFDIAGDALASTGEHVYGAGLDSNEVAVAAFDPRLREWDLLPSPPMSGPFDHLHVVWTDFEVWVWGSKAYGEGAGAAWSPRRRQWRPLPELNGVRGPVAVAWAVNRAFAVAADGTAASLGRGAVQWRRYARSPVRSVSSATIWNGHALLAFDPVTGRMAALDPRASGWTSFATPPLPSSSDGRLLWTGRDMFAFAGDSAVVLKR